MAQEVFIQLFISINDFRGGAKLSTWIYRKAVTKSLDHLKRLKRKKRFAVIKRLFGEDEMEDQIPSNEETDPEKELDNKERMKVLNMALDKLPENQRIAFTLSKYDEMSYKEIADILALRFRLLNLLFTGPKAACRKNCITIIISIYRN